MKGKVTVAAFAAIGIGAGAAFGAATGSMGICVAIGAAIGAAAGMHLRKRAHMKEDRP